MGVRAVVKIDSFNFGVITIGGTKYWMRDVVIFPEGTVRRRRFGRWLANHHKYAKEDIADLISAGAEIIVVGTGVLSGVRLTGDMRDQRAEEPWQENRGANSFTVLALITHIHHMATERQSFQWKFLLDSHVFQYK